MSNHFAAGLELINAEIELTAETAAGHDTTYATQRVADCQAAWDAEVAAEAPPGTLAADLDTELADRAGIYTEWATWCALAMVDPAAAQAQVAHVNLPTQEETDSASALDTAFQVRDTAANYLGI